MDLWIGGIALVAILLFFWTGILWLLDIIVIIGPDIVAGSGDGMSGGLTSVLLGNLIYQDVLKKRKPVSDERST